MWVAELEGALLDYWVARAEGKSPVFIHMGQAGWWVSDGQLGEAFEAFLPSSDWAQGGPIIEREKIDLREIVDGWEAFVAIGAEQSGRTVLEAVMRAFVFSKFGDIVEDAPPMAR